jgi:hypothetical protein
MTMKFDGIEIEILADGTVKFTTPKISGANHQSADAFLKTASDLLGGETTRTRRLDANQNLRSALDAHAADGHTHDHGHSH